MMILMNIRKESCGLFFLFLVFLFAFSLGHQGVAETTPKPPLGWFLPPPWLYGGGRATPWCPRATPNFILFLIKKKLIR
jgi:hypothetical protein